jgi:hypothetical protein
MCKSLALFRVSTGRHTRAFQHFLRDAALSVSAVSGLHSIFGPLCSLRFASSNFCLRWIPVAYFVEALDLHRNVGAAIRRSHR